MRQPVIRVLLHKIPNFLVRAVLDGKASLFIFNLTVLKGIVTFVFLLSGSLLVRLGLIKLHSDSLALLLEVLLDALVDSLDIEHSAASFEGLEHDMVLDVFEHLVINPAKSSGTSEPNVFSVLIVLVVVLPDPSATVTIELTSEKCLYGSLLDNLGIRINLLTLLRVLGWWEVKLELFLFLFRKTGISTFLCPPLLLLLIKVLLIIDITNVEHAEE